LRNHRNLFEKIKPVFGNFTRLKLGKNSTMTASIIYEGNLRCRAVHTNSAHTIETDAPTDNHGKGEKFSPTDLVCTALGTCILTTIAIKAGSLGLELANSTAEVTKHMENAPRRIARIEVDIRLASAQPLDEQQRDLLIRTGNACPVARSLHPEIELHIRYS
jgi:uncharacterized OsmC-like protein